MTVKELKEILNSPYINENSKVLVRNNETNHFISKISSQIEDIGIEDIPEVLINVC